MNRVLKFAGVAVLAMNMAACATVTRGSSTDFKVFTTPGGAQVATTNGFNCPSTPCTIRMPRRSQFNATISREGYQTMVVEIINRVSTGGGAGLAGNLLLGGVIGAAVDAGTGAALDLRPNPLVLTLTPGEGTINMSSAQAEALSLAAPTPEAAPPPAQPRRNRRR